MKVFDVTAENFRELPGREGVKNGFGAVLIIPTGELHESGWGMFAVVGCRRGEAVCLWSEYSDVLALDGIGGYGSTTYIGKKQVTDIKGWEIDVTPRGIIRIHADQGYALFLPEVPVSIFEIFAERPKK